MPNRPQSAQPRLCAKSAGAPNVGIFWQYGKRLIVAGTPLAKAEAYGEHMIFSSSHLNYWAELQRAGTVSRETEYEEYPRGRVIYNTKAHKFTLMADKCIIKNKRLVTRIMSTLRLPKNTKVVTDSHYRCAKCMETKATRTEQEKDWDF